MIPGMKGYPLLLNLEGRRAVVIGAGKVARRKVNLLLEAGAEVVVIGPPTDPVLAGWICEHKVANEPRSYRAGDLAGAVLAFAATDDGNVNRLAREEARAEGIPVNVATDPELCDFTVPSVLRRGDLTIAISTGASAPRLARRIREHLERQFGPEYGVLLDILGDLRPRIVAADGDEPAKRDLFDRILDSGILDLIRAGKEAEARSLADRLLQVDPPLK